MTEPPVIGRSCQSTPLVEAKDDTLPQTTSVLLPKAMLENWYWGSPFFTTENVRFIRDAKECPNDASRQRVSVKINRAGMYYIEAILQIGVKENACLQSVVTFLTRSAIKEWKHGR